MRKFKETKKQFDRVREDMELSLARNAQAPRHRPHEAEEAAGALVLARKCFRHLALDYVLQVSPWAFPCPCRQGAAVWRGPSGLRKLEMLGNGHGGRMPTQRPEVGLG